eukprot:1157781-Pleurochrysis_carterae.AAC.1
MHVAVGASRGRIRVHVGAVDPRQVRAGCQTRSERLHIRLGERHGVVRERHIVEGEIAQRDRALRSRGIGIFHLFRPLLHRQHSLGM